MKSLEYAYAPPSEIEGDIARLETALKQLKVQYDMFFAGALARQPLELRREVERIIRRHRNSPMPKYHHRFHFNALVSRFNSLSELWGKTVRTLEEGDRRTHAGLETGGLRERLLARCLVGDPRADDKSMRGLYDRYLDARRENGQEKQPPSFQKFLRGVTNQTRRLQKESGCAEIELRLVVRDQKVQLKARPGR
jgi:hypothetical protein